MHLRRHHHQHLIYLAHLYNAYPPSHATNGDTMQNPESRAIVPGIAFGDFARRFREPEAGEGFEDVVRVEFRFRGDDEARRVWGQYWI